MAGYTRQKSAEIVLGAVARASDIGAELDQVQAAFNSSTGHNHSGTAGEGGPITVIGPAQDFISTSSVFRPKTDNIYDLGSVTFEFKDGYFDGTLYTDALELNGTLVTSTAAELNILDGVTATAAELNILDGVTASTAELNFVDGVTSAIQTQLDGKQALDADLTAIAALGTTGILVRTASNTWALRTETAGSGISITNGDGVLGNMTVAVDSTVVRTTGAQSIAGNKTFDNDIVVGTFDLGFASTSGITLDAVGSDNNGVVRVKTWATTGNSQPTILSTQGLSDRFVVAANGNVTNLNNSYGAISDIKFKTDIEPCTDQLEDLRKIEVVKYRLKEFGEDSPKQTGVIAQQLQEVKPGLVEENYQGDLSVKYSVLNILLLKAVQELADKVEVLEAKVAELSK